MRIALEVARTVDAAQIAALQNDVADDLTAKYGKGHWSAVTTVKGVLNQMRTGKVFVARRRGRIMATLRLCTKKPWAIDTANFTKCKRPLYLLNMAVTPALQRKSTGRACVEESLRIARAWPADAIRLDAYDAPAGAGGFYAKCGFDEVGRVVYRTVPLLYYEAIL